MKEPPSRRAKESHSEASHRDRRHRPHRPRDAGGTGPGGAPRRDGPHRCLGDTHAPAHPGTAPRRPRPGAPLGTAVGRVHDDELQLVGLRGPDVVPQRLQPSGERCEGQLGGAAGHGRTGSSFSSNWVGIDGFSSTTVEQIGTLQQWSGGTAQYSAWYEIYPAMPVTIGTIDVHPGDVMVAEVRWVTGNMFALSLTNSTTAQSFTTTQTVPGGNVAQRSSGECDHGSALVGQQRAAAAPCGAVLLHDVLGHGERDHGAHQRLRLGQRGHHHGRCQRHAHPDHLGTERGGRRVHGVRGAGAGAACGRRGFATRRPHWAPSRCSDRAARRRRWS